ncbi:hypothetical protein ACFL0Q_07625 [Thermodesulfobacteriota bacterium]
MITQGAVRKFVEQIVLEGLSRASKFRRVRESIRASRSSEDPVDAFLADCGLVEPQGRKPEGVGTEVDRFIRECGLKRPAKPLKPRDADVEAFVRETSR